MCGRYYFSNPKGLREESPAMYSMIINMYGENELVEISPGCDAPVFVYADGSFKLANMRWGFTTESGHTVINAKSETLEQRSMFTGISKRQRCIIPSSGYYEWRRGDGQKFSFSPDEENRIMLIAGMYRYENDGFRFTVITREPTQKAAMVHDRMPVILRDKNAAIGWLSGSGTEEYYTDNVELKIRAEGSEQMMMQF